MLIRSEICASQGGAIGTRLATAQQESAGVGLVAYMDNIEVSMLRPVEEPTDIVPFFGFSPPA